ncbi:MAG TPA: UDP-glucose--hexose-1-phosphate uridylyltransferase [Candidatus Methylomirabilis sp.]|nr:UDP-glucose--hexose-1-phosphate uridylyltransferase [Candidatus Methylomirabilis sp.]
MSLSELQQGSHRRFNPLVREWVLVSPHRLQRPWVGRIEKTASLNEPEYDPGCYLCPGNQRANGARNPQYAGTFVFDNDYPALLPDAPQLESKEDSLLIAESEAGLCRVVCFSPRHDLTIPVMSAAEVRQVVDIWSEQFSELQKLPWVRHIQIFENRGTLLGASNPHPHCQIWANASLPNVPARELASFEDYSARAKSCLLCDYLDLELHKSERVVYQNDGFAVLVPYWAVWPFETLVVSKRHFSAMDEFTFRERDLLADLLRNITARYDNLFQTSFPYSMGFHQRPTDGKPHAEWHFHAHYCPPLLRSATIQKFMVGYELLASPQRDITPESAASRLRELSAVHYLHRG